MENVFSESEFSESVFSESVFYESVFCESVFSQSVFSELFATRRLPSPNFFQTERTRLVHLPSFCELVLIGDLVGYLHFTTATSPREILLLPDIFIGCMHISLDHYQV